GTPRVTAHGEHDAAAQTYTLRLTQQTPATPGQTTKQPQVIPVVLGLLDRHGAALALDADGRTEQVLVLDQAEQTFVFQHIASEPVPSLLRGFSAPVVLDDGLSDAALLVLMRHDSDPFNRWEAGQRLALNRILHALRAGQPLVLSPV